MQGSLPAGSGLTYVSCFDSVESTMDIAREAVAGLEPHERALFLSREQTRGRGRQGRVWAQPEVGFYGTFAFAAPSGIATVAGFSLVAGVAVARLFRTYGVTVQLKWPNDVLSESSAKVSGILIDIVTEQGTPWILTGIGINLSGEPTLSSATSSLATLCGKKLCVPDVACQLTPILLAAWSTYSNQGFAAFKSEWTSLACGIGKSIKIDTGSEHVSGVFSGVSARGGLLLQRGSELLEIISGHVLAG